MMLTRRASLVLPAALLAPPFIPGARAQQARAPGWEQPTGFVSIEQTQVGLIIGATWGGGTLRFGGQTYRFKLKGLGVGEIGASKITASGEVFGLKRILDFPGAYSQTQVSATGPEKGVGTGLWLKNSHGVRLNLRAQRQGLQLSIAADGLVIEMS